MAWIEADAKLHRASPSSYFRVNTTPLIFLSCKLESVILTSEIPYKRQLFARRAPALTTVFVERLVSVTRIYSILMSLVFEITSPVPMRLTVSSKPAKIYDPASF